MNVKVCYYIKISGFNEDFYFYNKKLIKQNLILIDFYLFFSFGVAAMQMWT